MWGKWINNDDLNTNELQNTKEEKTEKEIIAEKISTLLWIHQSNALENKNIEGFINSGYFGIFLSIILNSEELEFKSIEGIAFDSEIDFWWVIWEYFSKKVEDIFEEWSKEKNFLIELEEKIKEKWNTREEVLEKTLDKLMKEIIDIYNNLDENKIEGRDYEKLWLIIWNIDTAKTIGLKIIRAKSVLNNDLDFLKNI